MKNLIKLHRHQRGAALVVGLMMLVIVTLLAVTAMGTATTELVMAGNEQFRERSFQAAEAGLEMAILKSRTGDDDVPGDCNEYLDSDDNAMPSQDQNPDTYSSRLSFTGTNNLFGKATSVTFGIQSTGTSVRNATSVHDASTWVLGPLDESNVDDLCVDAGAGGGGELDQQL
jgi:type IV pilus assembly protein PilX